MRTVFRLILPAIGLGLAACAYGQSSPKTSDSVAHGESAHAVLMSALREAADPAACPVLAQSDNANSISLYRLDAQHRLAETVCWQGQQHETWFLAVLDQNDRILASYANAAWRPQSSALLQYERDDEKLLDTCPKHQIWADGAFHLAYAAQCEQPD